MKNVQTKIIQMEKKVSLYTGLYLQTFLFRSHLIGKYCIFLSFDAKELPLKCGFWIFTCFLLKMEMQLHTAAIIL